MIVNFCLLSCSWLVSILFLPGGCSNKERQKRIALASIVFEMVYEYYKNIAKSL